MTLLPKTEIVDAAVHARAVQHVACRGVYLPTFAQLADPGWQSPALRASLQQAAAGSASDPRHLLRIHWYNDEQGGQRTVPAFLHLPTSVTGVKATILVAVARHFPLIGAHKVLPAYAALVSRLVTGQFDPTQQRAVWPSTGNYCRGGVAVSKLLGCRGVAVLPAGMSAERFAWLRQWVADPSDVIATPGSESNVKEIYDACHRLAADPRSVILNQFQELSNYLSHYTCTGPALAEIFEAARRDHPPLRLAAFIAGTGSAGTLAAGDWLKDRYGIRIAALEALECPTLLENGFGEHNIQGIGDKHVPLIHNVMNTDFVVGVSDSASDQLFCLLQSPAGRDALASRRAIARSLVTDLSQLGLSGLANIVGAIKLAHTLRLSEDDVVITVATDSAELYQSEIEKVRSRDFGGRFDASDAAEVFGRHIAGANSDATLELTESERRRIFNLGYFTWVEQQGIGCEDFVARRTQAFWRRLRSCVAGLDALIDDFNRRTGASAS